MCRARACCRTPPVMSLSRPPQDVVPIERQRQHSFGPLACRQQAACKRSNGGPHLTTGPDFSLPQEAEITTYRFADLVRQAVADAPPLTPDQSGRAGRPVRRHDTAAFAPGDVGAGAAASWAGRAVPTRYARAVPRDHLRTDDTGCPRPRARRPSWVTQRVLDAVARAELNWHRQEITDAHGPHLHHWEAILYTCRGCGAFDDI